MSVQESLVRSMASMGRMRSAVYFRTYHAVDHCIYVYIVHIQGTVVIGTRQGEADESQSETRYLSPTLINSGH